MGGFSTGFGKPAPKLNAGGGGGIATGFGGDHLPAGGAARGPQAAKKPDLGIGGVAGWLGGKLSLAGHDLLQMPGGMYVAAKAISHDIGKASGEVGIPQDKRFTKGGWETPGLAKGMVHSTVQSFKHPLRDPFMTGLNVAALAAPVGKLGEAGLAAKAADVAGGESRLAEAAKALARTHGEQPPRVLKSGGRVVKQDGVTMRIGGNREVNLIPSRNAAVRLGQRAYDKGLQSALNKEAQAQGAGRIVSRVAAHAKGRVGGALAEEQRAVQRMTAIPADQLERSAVKLSKIPLKASGLRGQRLTGIGRVSLHSAAEHLVSEQVTPEVAAARHAGLAEMWAKQARTGVDEAGNVLSKSDRKAALDNAKRNRGASKLFAKVGQHDLVHVDLSRPDGEKVFINPEKSKLAAADAVAEHLGNEGERIVTEHNLMSQEGQRARLDNPGQFYAGAEYVKPTPGRLGHESPILKEARAQLAKAEKLHAQAALRAMGKVENTRSVMHRFASREMTPAEAQARLAELEKVHQGMIDKMIPEVSPYQREVGKGGREYSPEQMNRNFNQGKTGKRQLETVKQEEQRLAEEKMREMAQKHAGTGKAWADALHNHLNELDTLRAALQSHQDANSFFGNGEKPMPFPHVAGEGYNYQMPWEHDPTVQRLSGAVSLLKDRVQRLEAAHANRIEPTGFVGGEGALQGRTFVPHGSSEKAGRPGVMSASQRRAVIGEAQNPIAKNQRFEAENLRQGKVPKNVFLSMAKHYRQLAKFENTLNLRKAIYEADHSPVKRSGRDILMRVPGGNARPLTEQMKQAIGEAQAAVHDHASLQEIHAGTQEGLAALHQWLNKHILDQAEASRGQMIGARAQHGYAWVDSKLVHQLEKDAAPSGTGVRSGIGKAFDNTNSAVTALTVYFKVGHVFTRGLTNAVTNVMQGSLRPDHFKQSIDLWKALTPEERMRAVAAAGQQGFAALPHEGSEGLVGRAVAGTARSGSRFWAHHFDAPFRFNSLAYELRKVGYGSPEKFREALDAIQQSGRGLPAHQWSKISAAFRRADREAISYDRLNEFEKKYLARAVWFYPWVKGSSLFTVRSILEHPFKMAGAGALAKQSEARQQKILGDVPSYEQGLLPLGKGASPETVDMSTFSPVGTLGQLANVPSVKGAIAQQLNPVLGAGVGLATGTNSYGEPSNNPYADALNSLLSSTPEAQIVDAFRRKGQNTSGRMFPGMTPGAEFRRYFFGPGIPRFNIPGTHIQLGAGRNVNKAALAKAARREHEKRYTVYSGG